MENVALWTAFIWGGVVVALFGIFWSRSWWRLRSIERSLAVIKVDIIKLEGWVDPYGSKEKNRARQRPDQLENDDIRYFHTEGE